MRGRPLTPSVANVSAWLTACVEALAQIEAVPVGQLAALLGQVGALQHVVSARLVRDLLVRDEAAHEMDRLLTVTEAAERLACSPDWLYRHRLPFAVRNGRQLRFSATGLDRYIRQQAARETTFLPPRVDP